MIGKINGTINCLSGTKSMKILSDSERSEEAIGVTTMLTFFFCVRDVDRKTQFVCDLYF